MNQTLRKTRNAEIWLDNKGICHQVYLPDSFLTIEDSKKELQIFSELSSGKKLPVLIDLNGLNSIPRECRTYYASDKTAAILSAVALLVGTHKSRVIGNFFIGLNKSLMPVKLFTSEDKALKWLADFI